MSSIGMDLRSRTIEIPIRNSEEVIELECTSLPEAEEVLQILIQEKAQMKIWVRLALEYWRQERKLEFAQILESARQDAGQDYHGHEKDTMRCLDTLVSGRKYFICIQLIYYSLF
jgi:RNA polymerase-associated protein CTR9